MGAVRADREPGNGAETDRPAAENPLTSSTTVLSNDESCEKYHLRMGAEMLRINYTQAPYNPLAAIVTRLLAPFFVRSVSKTCARRCRYPDGIQISTTEGVT